MMRVLALLVACGAAEVAWQPELRHWWEGAESSDLSGTMRRAVAEELRRSLEVYPR